MQGVTNHSQSLYKSFNFSHGIVLLMEEMSLTSWNAYNKLVSSGDIIIPSAVWIQYESYHLTGNCGNVFFFGELPRRFRDAPLAFGFVSDLESIHVYTPVFLPGGGGGKGDAMFSMVFSLPLSLSKNIYFEREFHSFHHCWNCWNPPTLEPGRWKFGSTTHSVPTVGGRLEGRWKYLSCRMSKCGMTRT